MTISHQRYVWSTLDLCRVVLGCCSFSIWTFNASSADYVPFLKKNKTNNNTTTENPFTPQKTLWRLKLLLESMNPYSCGWGRKNSFTRSLLSQAWPTQAALFTGSISGCPLSPPGQALGRDGDTPLAQAVASVASLRVHKAHLVVAQENVSLFLKTIWDGADLLFVIPLARLFNIICLSAWEKVTSLQHLPFEPRSMLHFTMAGCPLAEHVLLAVQLF